MLLSLAYVLVLGLLAIVSFVAGGALWISIFRVTKGPSKKWYLLASLLALLLFLALAFFVLRTWEADRQVLEKSRQTQTR